MLLLLCDNGLEIGRIGGYYERNIFELNYYFGEEQADEHEKDGLSLYDFRCFC